ncbi:MAG: hypothetical protein U0Q18_31180 [Bryobacteraceae bacterium]
MDERSQIRAASLARYTCLRRYQLKNQRFHQTAELSVRMTYTAPGHKTFEVLSEHGLSVIRQKVLRRMLEAEEEASRDDERARSQITARNYDFELLRSEMWDGRLTYVLKATPKAVSKFLLRGRIWVDSEDFAILRVEATPAQRPSALIHNINVVQQYQKIGASWLPLYNRSMSDSFWFGHTDVSIDSSDYQVSQPQQELPADQTPGSRSTN